MTIGFDALVKDKDYLEFPTPFFNDKFINGFYFGF